MEAVRKQGLATVGQVAEAVLETGGVISVVPSTTAEERMRHLHETLQQIQAQVADVHRLVEARGAGSS